MTEIFEAIPSFIEAPTKQGLVNKMLETNARDYMNYRYFDIQYIEENGKKTWVAWYYPESDLRRG